jgi:hypothetical protein
LLVEVAARLVFLDKVMVAVVVLVVFCTEV